MPGRPPLALRPRDLSVRTPLALAAALTAGCVAGSSGAPRDGAPVAPVNGLSVPTLLDCRDLKGLVPQELGKGIALRPATPTSDTTLAWGDPAITLRCGVKAGLRTDQHFTFDDVAWAMHDDGASRRWTTTGRKVNVEVVIPDAYDAQAELLGALAQPIKDAKL